MESTETRINDIPNEILRIIFSYLSATDLCFRIARVCLRWKMVVNDPNLLRNYKISFGPRHSRKCITDTLDCLSNISGIQLRNRKEDTSRILEQIVLKCRNLSGLDVKDCGLIRSSDLWELSQNNTHISVLHFDVNSLTGDCVSMIRYFFHLKELKITGMIPEVTTHITGAFLRNLIENCLSLTELHIDFGSNIWDYNLLYIINNKYKTLTGLSLYARQLSDSSLARLELCTRLKSLKLVFILRISDMVLNSIAKLKLHQLCLWQVPCMTRVTTQSQMALDKFFAGKNMAQLIRLELISCVNISDNTLKALSFNCTKLQFFTLHDSERVTSDGIEGVIKRCTKLKKLVLSALKIGGHWLGLVAIHLLHLEKLEISFCRHIFKEQIDCLQISFPSLKISHDCLEKEYNNAYAPLDEYESD